LIEWKVIGLSLRLQRRMSYENIETREYRRYVTVYIQESQKRKSPNYEIDKGDGMVMYYWS
jgi:hypothetical protein